MRGWIKWWLGCLVLAIGEGEGGGAEGDAGGDGAGGEGDAGQPDAGVGGTGADDSGKGDAPAGGEASKAGDEPKSILEAIERAGLKKPSEQPQQTPESKQVAQQKKPGEKDQQGQQDDPLQVPQGMSPDATSRFKRLVGVVKEKDTLIQQHEGMLREQKETIDSFRGFLSENRVTPDQFGQAVEVLGLVNSRNPESMRRARDIMLREARNLSLMLGEPMPDGASDILGEFPDLQEAVAAMKITEQHAIELAKGRKDSAARQAADQQANQQRQNSAQDLQVKQQAHAQISQMTQHWAANDLDYKLKEDKILAKLPQILAAYHPTQWAQAIKDQYDALTEALAEARKLGGNGGAREPRPHGGTGGGPSNPQAPPSNMMQAMQRGLGVNS